MLFRSGLRGATKQGDKTDATNRGPDARRTAHVNLDSRRGIDDGCDLEAESFPTGNVETKAGAPGSGPREDPHQRITEPKTHHKKWERAVMLHGNTGASKKKTGGSASPAGSESSGLPPSLIWVSRGQIATLTTSENPTRFERE